MVTSHMINLFGLEKNTTYFYAVDCTDEADNDASDDNGGGCYTFTTPDAPDYFTESFSTGDYDLAYHSLTFLPDGSPDYYSGCTEAIGAGVAVITTSAPLPLVSRRTSATVSSAAALMVASGPKASAILSRAGAMSAM